MDSRESSTRIFASGCSQISRVWSSLAPVTQPVITSHLNGKPSQPVCFSVRVCISVFFKKRQRWPCPARETKYLMLFGKFSDPRCSLFYHYFFFMLGQIEMRLLFQISPFMFLQHHITGNAQLSGLWTLLWGS